MKSFLVDMSKSSTTNRTRASAGISMSNVNSSSHFGLKPGQHRQRWRSELLTNKEGKDAHKQGWRSEILAGRIEVRDVCKWMETLTD